MTDRSWTEIQALAVRAATGAAVPPAQALAFGAMATRHLADGGNAEPLSAALSNPDTILTLARQIEEAIETASVTGQSVRIAQNDAAQRALLISWLASLPCQTEITTVATEIQARLSLTDPSARTRPARVWISHALYEQMQNLAARTYVPDSAASRATGAGAGLMELD